MVRAVGHHHHDADALTAACRAAAVWTATWAANHCGTTWWQVWVTVSGLACVQGPAHVCCCLAASPANAVTHPRRNGTHHHHHHPFHPTQPAGLGTGSAWQVRTATSGHGTWAGARWHGLRQTRPGCSHPRDQRQRGSTAAGQAPWTISRHRRHLKSVWRPRRWPQHGGGRIHVMPGRRVGRKSWRWWVS